MFCMFGVGMKLHPAGLKFAFPATASWFLPLLGPQYYARSLHGSPTNPGSVSFLLSLSLEVSLVTLSSKSLSPLKGLLEP